MTSTWNFRSRRRFTLINIQLTSEGKHDLDVDESEDGDEWWALAVNEFDASRVKVNQKLFKRDSFWNPDLSRVIEDRLAVP